MLIVFARFGDPYPSRNLFWVRLFVKKYLLRVSRASRACYFMGKWVTCSDLSFHGTCVPDKTQEKQTRSSNKWAKLIKCYRQISRLQNQVEFTGSHIWEAQRWGTARVRWMCVIRPWHWRSDAFSHVLPPHPKVIRWPLCPQADLPQWQQPQWTDHPHPRACRLHGNTEDHHSTPGLGPLPALTNS